MQKITPQKYSFFSTGDPFLHFFDVFEQKKPPEHLSFFLSPRWHEMGKIVHEFTHFMLFGKFFYCKIVFRVLSLRRCLDKECTGKKRVVNLERKSDAGEPCSQDTPRHSPTLSFKKVRICKHREKD